MIKIQFIHYTSSVTFFFFFFFGATGTSTMKAFKLLYLKKETIFANIAFSFKVSLRSKTTGKNSQLTFCSHVFTLNSCHLVPSGSPFSLPPSLFFCSSLTLPAFPTNQPPLVFLPTASPSSLLDTIIFYLVRTAVTRRVSWVFPSSSATGLQKVRQLQTFCVSSVCQRLQTTLVPTNSNRRARHDSS